MKPVFYVDINLPQDKLEEALKKIRANMAKDKSDRINGRPNAHNDLIDKLIEMEKDGGDL